MFIDNVPVTEYRVVQWSGSSNLRRKAYDVSVTAYDVSVISNYVRDEFIIEKLRCRFTMCSGGTKRQ